MGRGSGEASTISETVVTPRGEDALEIKLKDRGMSSVEIREARKSFNEGHRVAVEDIFKLL